MKLTRVLPVAAILALFLALAGGLRPSAAQSTKPVPGDYTKAHAAAGAQLQGEQELLDPFGKKDRADHKADEELMKHGWDSL